MIGRLEKGSFDNEKKAICGIIMQYLDDEGMCQAAKGLRNDCINERMMNWEELGRFLNIQTGNYLKYFLRKLKQEMKEVAVQTQVSVIEGVEFKLLALETEFKHREITENKTQNKEADHWKIKDEKIRKEKEIESVRLEEQSKYRRLLYKQKNDIENYWNAKVEELNEREIKISQIKNLAEEEANALRENFKVKIEEMKKRLQKEEDEIREKYEERVAEAENSRRCWEVKNCEVDKLALDLEVSKQNLVNKFNNNLIDRKALLDKETNEERMRISHDRTELEIAQEHLKKQVQQGIQAKEKVKILESVLKEKEEKVQFYQNDYEKIVLKLKETQMELDVALKSFRRDSASLNLRNDEINLLRNEISIYKEMFKESRDRVKNLEKTYQELVKKMVFEIKGGAGSTEKNWCIEIQEFYRSIERESFKLKKEMLSLIERNNN